MAKASRRTRSYCSNLSERVGIDNLAWAHGRPDTVAVIRREPDDFQVEEIPLFEPAGTGSHAWLRIRKRSANTQWVAQRLVEFISGRSADVGYAGMKDRHAVTIQWFSVDLKGHALPDWSAFDDEDMRVLEVVPHPKKLRRGQLSGNRFRIRLRELTPCLLYTSDAADDA